MKSNTLRSRVIGSLLMLMIITVSAQAQERRGPHPQKQGQERMEKGGKGAEKPDRPRIPGITEEQEEQMKAIHLEMEKAGLPIRNQIGEKEARFRTLVTADSYDEKAVNRVLDEIGDLKTDMRKLKVASLQKAKKVLNDEQMMFLYKHMDKGPGQKGGPKGGKRGR